MLHDLWKFDLILISACGLAFGQQVIRPGGATENSNFFPQEVQVGRVFKPKSQISIVTEEQDPRVEAGQMLSLRSIRNQKLIPSTKKVGTFIKRVTWQMYSELLLSTSHPPGRGRGVHFRSHMQQIHVFILSGGVLPQKKFPNSTAAPHAAAVTVTPKSHQLL